MAECSGVKISLIASKPGHLLCIRIEITAARYLSRSVEEEECRRRREGREGRREEEKERGKRGIS